MNLYQKTYTLFDIKFIPNNVYPNLNEYKPTNAYWRKHSI